MSALPDSLPIPGAVAAVVVVVVSVVAATGSSSCTIAIGEDGRKYRMHGPS